MKVAIIDADLIGRQKHRFPNLVCEKLSAFWKEKGAEVILKLDYENLDKYDDVYISKVFTDTWVPDWIAEAVNMDIAETTLPSNIHVGGTGFFFAHAPNLPDEIEHHMPDYHLYDTWIENEVARAESDAEAEGKVFRKSNFMVQFKEYTDYSIGFMTRGCFRKCPFCVNQKYDHVFVHSPLDEFYDETRKKICLLDDNFLGCPRWKDILLELMAKKKPFKFKQGMDERLLTEERCELLFSASYDGDYTFAFDNISDYDLIHRKLQLIRKYTSATNVKFYILVGFESTDIITLYSKRSELEKYIDSAEKNVIREEIELENAKKDLESLLKELSDALSKDKKNLKLRKQAELAEKARNKVSEIISEIKGGIRKQISDEMSSKFFELMWKRKFSKVEITENYSASVINNDGFECLGSCSAAERELLVLAFTLALHKESGFDGPLVIDTPISRISGDLRVAFAKVLRSVSENKQIILFVTEDEYSMNVRDVFEPYANRKYKFELVDEDFVKVGDM